ncbi:Ku protein, partial [Rhizobium johnstonii]
AEVAPKSNVVSIMDALRKSVEADLKGRKAG